MQLLYMGIIIMLLLRENVRNAIFASTDMVWRDMEQRILSIEIRAVTKAVDRYLGESMPQTAKETTGGNAHIIMFLARNRGSGDLSAHHRAEILHHPFHGIPRAGADGEERADRP